MYVCSDLRLKGVDGVQAITSAVGLLLCSVRRNRPFRTRSLYQVGLAPSAAKIGGWETDGRTTRTKIGYHQSSSHRPSSAARSSSRFTQCGIFLQPGHWSVIEGMDLRALFIFMRIIFNLRASFGHHYHGIYGALLYCVAHPSRAQLIIQQQTGCHNLCSVVSNISCKIEK